MNVSRSMITLYNNNHWAQICSWVKWLVSITYIKMNDNSMYQPFQLLLLQTVTVLLYCTSSTTSYNHETTPTTTKSIRNLNCLQYDHCNISTSTILQLLLLLVLLVIIWWHVTFWFFFSWPLEVWGVHDTINDIWPL